MSENGAGSPPADQTMDHQEQDQEPQAASGSPSDFLKQVVGEQVVVRLNSGVDYRGEFELLGVHPTVHSREARFGPSC